MVSSSIYLTPNRRENQGVVFHPAALPKFLPTKKRLKSTTSPLTSDKANSDDEVMAALSLTESLTKKLDLILARQMMTNEMTNEVG